MIILVAEPTTTGLPVDADTTTVSVNTDDTTVGDALTTSSHSVKLALGKSQQTSDR